jgi:hypothetical protein
LIQAIIAGLSEVLAFLGNFTGGAWNSNTASALHHTTDDVVETAQQVVHVDTGTLQASLGPTYDYGLRMDAIQIQPGFINPKHGLPSTYYGPIEEARGGAHAFFQITYDLWKDAAGSRFFSYLFGGM